jgi:hypothetical protein
LLALIFCISFGSSQNTICCLPIVNATRGRALYLFF